MRGFGAFGVFFRGVDLVDWGIFGEFLGVFDEQGFWGGGFWAVLVDLGDFGVFLGRFLGVWGSSWLMQEGLTGGFFGVFWGFQG